MIKIMHENHVLSTGSISKSRPDVVKKFSQLRLALDTKAGFLITEQLTNEMLKKIFGPSDSSELTVLAVFKDGRVIEIFKLKVMKCNENSL